MSSLNIAVLGPARFGLGEPFAGGLEAHTIGLARGLMQRGHRVTVFGGTSDAFSPTDVEVVPLLESVGAELQHGDRLDTAMPAALALRIDEGYRRVLTQITDRGGFDIVHNNSLHRLPVMWEARLGVPVVHVLHCPPFPELASAHFLRSVVGGSPRRDVIAVSESLARQWGDVPTSVVWNGIDTDRWKRRPDAGDRRGCAWAGRMVSEKGPHHAIDAARLAGREIALAGPVQEPRYFDEQIRPRLGADAVFHGHLDNDGLVELFGTAEVGVVTPCWDEPFGLVVAEMLACATPVAAFDRGALRDIIGPDVGVLATGGDVAGLAAAIDDASVLSHAACRTFAVEHLSVLSMIDGYVERYEQAVGDALSVLAG